MWLHPATQANLELLRGRGVHVVGPATGELAEGQVGIGRMAEPEEIAAVVAALLEAAPLRVRSTLAGRTVVVSAGGTREPLDDVRFLGNRSSGRMGVAVAEAARERGATVTLLAANLAVPVPTGVDVVEAGTACRAPSRGTGASRCRRDRDGRRRRGLPARRADRREAPEGR